MFLLTASISVGLCFSLYWKNSRLRENDNKYRMIRQIYPNTGRWVDVMVFQSLCGFRYSDVRASKWNVINEVLIGYPKKQNKKQEGKNVKPYQIPFLLDARIKEILERYNYNMDLIVDQDYNRDMKKLLQKFFEHYQINQTDITYYKYRFQEEHKFTKPKYKLFASHSCRRGFINRWSKHDTCSETGTAAVF